MSVSLRKFDLASLTSEATLCFCSKRHSGKSFLIREIMHHFRSIPCGIVLAPTDKATDFYASFIPSSFVHYDYRPELLSSFFHRQEYIIEKNKKRTASGKAPLDDRAFLIMDDCLSSKGEWGKDPNVAKMFFEGRHYKALFIFAMQFPLALKPEFRSNFDFVFLLGEDFISNQKRLYEHYAGMFPTFELFRKVFTEATDNYGCLVINNRVKSKNIEDKVFWYRARDPGPFIVGNAKFRLFHQRRFNPDWKEKENKVDLYKTAKKVGLELPVRLLKS